MKQINNKKYIELDYNLQLFIKDICSGVSNNSRLKCFKNSQCQKYDIIIEIENKVKRISLKKGIKNSVHTESISEFIHFLIKNKMLRNLVISFLKYHYADGTTNGTGINRMKIEEYKKTHQKEIDEINKFINQEHIIRKIVERFITKGRNSNYCIDAIIYGVSEDLFG